MNDLIERLSEIRSQYNCFDESEEPYYRALTEAIEVIRERQKIIYCRDCKRADKFHHCEKVTWWNGANDYCSRAEERCEE